MNISKAETLMDLLIRVIAYINGEQNQKKYIYLYSSYKQLS